jgi:hypothetical protein
MEEQHPEAGVPAVQPERCPPFHCEFEDPPRVRRAPTSCTLLGLVNDVRSDEIGKASG